MKRLLKFLHTLGAVGTIGAMASLLACMIASPPPAALANYALIHAGMSDIATWIFIPSLALTLICGLLAMASHRAYKTAGWAWAKLATGLLILAGGVVFVVGPIRADAARSAQALAGALDPSALTGSYGAEPFSMWAMLALSTANVMLGVWRPKIAKLRSARPIGPENA